MEIKEIAREPGFRSKVAVASRQEGVDPVGSCIGMRGNRIQSIVNELQGEKIDIVRWDKDLKTFISNALSPSEVVQVEANADNRTAVVVVPERHLSLAIGKEGQNARLAAKLSGWHLDIKSVAEWDEIRAQRKGEEEARRLALEAAGRAAAAVATLEVPTTTDEEVEELVEAVAEVLEVKVEKTEEEEAQLLRMIEEEVATAAVEVEATAVVEPADIPTLVAPAEDALLEDLFDEEEDEDDEADEEDGEEPQEGVADDTIWNSPIVNPDAGKIRFAEDFADEFRGRGRRGGRRRRGGYTPTRVRGAGAAPGRGAAPGHGAAPSRPGPA